MKQLVFASNNAHKVRELRQLLGSDYEVLSLADIGCTADIPETADTFEGNALQKAVWVQEHYGLDCIADDSGLEVDALNGAPGVFSARYAAMAQNNPTGPTPSHDHGANNARLLAELEGKTDRSARFRTVIALVRKGCEPQFFTGKVEGRILDHLQGSEGFGYDPLFVPQGWDKTFAEATADEKNAVSHRGNAVRALVAYLSKNQ